MILGSRVYAVCCLQGIAFFFPPNHHGFLDFLTKQSYSVYPWICPDWWSDPAWHICQCHNAAFSIYGQCHRTPLRSVNGVIWLAPCLLGKKNLKKISPITFFHVFTDSPPFVWHNRICVGRLCLSLPIKTSFLILSRLTAWKAYGYWKTEVNTPMFDIIWRDGLLYFFAIFSMNVANVIIFSTLSPIVRLINLA